MIPRNFPARGLYLITPQDGDDASLLRRVRAVLPLANVLQYREKTVVGEAKRQRAAALRAMCREAGVCFIVNDDVALAHAVRADGVHLGADDGEPAQARARMGEDAVIGASCYASLERAQAAVAAGADYVAFGALFASPTKPLALRADAALFAQAAALDVPRVAIGGITPDNVREAIAAGADLIAVISAVFDAPDPVAAARAFQLAFENP